MGKEPEVEYMENHIGKTLDETKGFLSAQNVELTVEVVEEPSKDVEKGYVIRTNPVEGERLTDGMVVTLYVSSGPEVVEVEMEDLTKKTVEEATKWLENQKMDLEVKVEEEENLEKEEGTILRTKPAAGEKVKTGDTVTLYVAKGLKTELMPSLTGMTFDQAKKALAELEKNLNLKVEKMDGYSKNTELGKIIRTEPEYNQTIKTGDTIYIYVCVAQKAKIANVVGMNVEAAKMKLEEVQGFTKVTIEYKTSDKPKDMVIAQSVVADTETELDSPVVLTVSGGQKTVKKTVQYLQSSSVDGEGKPANVKVVITNTTTGKTVFSGTASTANTTMEVEITGYGVMNFEVVVEDGIERSTFSHNFDG
jgi:serine/threonine-protein kinase